jgi:hypothetical protein
MASLLLLLLFESVLPQGPYCCPATLLLVCALHVQGIHHQRLLLLLLWRMLLHGPCCCPSLGLLLVDALHVQGTRHAAHAALSVCRSSASLEMSNLTLEEQGYAMAALRVLLRLQLLLLLQQHRCSANG